MPCSHGHHPTLHSFILHPSFAPRLLLLSSLYAQQPDIRIQPLLRVSAHIVPHRMQGNGDGSPVSEQSELPDLVCNIFAI